MIRRPIVSGVAAVALAAGALVTTACGGDDSSASSTTAPATTAAPTTTAPATPVPSTAATPTTTAPAATAVKVALGTPKEFSLVPDVKSAASGKVTFTVTNSGKIIHEMVVVPGTPTSLTQPDGTASEDGTLGEVSDVEVGKTQKLTITMPPGTYTLLCNLPGHFANGMYASFTVK
jgi:uncharacterized cupredoxin-like copper-binding protein